MRKEKEKREGGREEAFGPHRGTGKKKKKKRGGGGKWPVPYDHCISTLISPFPETRKRKRAKRRVTMSVPAGTMRGKKKREKEEKEESGRRARVLPPPFLCPGRRGETKERERKEKERKGSVRVESVVLQRKGGKRGERKPHPATKCLSHGLFYHPRGKEKEEGEEKVHRRFHLGHKKEKGRKKAQHPRATPHLNVRQGSKGGREVGGRKEKPRRGSYL